MGIDPHALSAVYAENAPLPHIVLKNIWNEKMLKYVSQECNAFTDWDREKAFFGSVGKRSCHTFAKLPLRTQKIIGYCNGVRFLRLLGAIAGEKGLITDTYLSSGGIHSTINKGLLKNAC